MRSGSSPGSVHDRTPVASAVRSPGGGERSQRSDAGYSSTAAEEHDVDRVPHADGVHVAASFDPDGALGQPVRTQQAGVPLGARLGHPQRRDGCSVHHEVVVGRRGPHGREHGRVRSVHGGHAPTSAVLASDDGGDLSRAAVHCRPVALHTRGLQPQTHHRPRRPGGDARRHAERARPDRLLAGGEKDRGQASAEYAGIIFVVLAIIAALVTLSFTGIGEAIIGKIEDPRGALTSVTEAASPSSLCRP